MRFKVGDEVRIKEECKAVKIYGNEAFVLDMEKFKDMKLTISKVISDDEYYINEDNETWYYTDEMLEPFEFKEGDKVKLVRLDNEDIRHNSSYEENLNKVFIIKSIDFDKGGKYCRFEENYDIFPYLKNIELIKNCKDDTVKVDKITFGYDFFKIHNEGYLTNLEEPKINFEPLSISTDSCLTYKIRPEGFTEVIDKIDKLNNKNEREENFMEILNIYKDRKIAEINKNYNEKHQKIKEQDKVQQIIRDTENRLNVLLDRDEDNQVRLYFDDVEESTEEKFKEIEKEKYDRKYELENFIKEVKAQLEIAETYETKIDILKNYEVLDESGKIDTCEFKSKTNTKKSKK